MCDSCMKHGAGGKWYLNTSHYSDEIVEKYDLRDFLMEQYKNFEQISIRKTNGFNAVGLGYKLRIPIIVRLIKNTAEKMLYSTRPPSNPFKAEGYISQVVPFEDHYLNQWPSGRDIRHFGPIDFPYGSVVVIKDLRSRILGGGKILPDCICNLPPQRLVN